MRLLVQSLAIWFMLLAGWAPAAMAAVSGLNRAQALVEALAAEWEAPAVSAAVAVDGEVVFAGASGRTDVSGTPAGPDTRFRIASVSKAITGVLALRLADEGRLDLDAPLSRYLPDLSDELGVVTSRQLLAHTSGIRHYERGETSHKTVHFEDPLEALGSVLQEPLRFESGTEHSYTTYGYTLLQAVIEAATGQGFEETLRTRVLEPAGMTRTGLDRAGQESSRATGFDRGGAVDFDDVSFKYAGGGMVSTAADLVRLCASLDRGEILEAETRQSLLRPAYPELDASQSYGFAVKREITTGLLRLWHPGRGNGFEAYLLCYPEERVAAAVATNQDWTDPWKEVGRAAETLARIYLPAIHLYRTPPSVLVRRLESQIREGDVGGAVATYAAYREEIDGMWGAGLEVHRLAERLTGEGALTAARALFEANAQAYPDSWHSQVALAGARLRTGDLAGAAGALEAARPLVPGADVLASLESRIEVLGEPPVAPPTGEYSLALAETGLADRMAVTLGVGESESGLTASAWAEELGKLPVISILAGGDRLYAALESPHGLVELDLVRNEKVIAGSWRVGFESGPLTGTGPILTE